MNLTKICQFGERRGKRERKVKLSQSCYILEELEDDRNEAGEDIVKGLEILPGRMIWADLCLVIFEQKPKRSETMDFQKGCYRWSSMCKASQEVGKGTE